MQISAIEKECQVLWMTFGSLHAWESTSSVFARDVTTYFSRSRASDFRVSADLCSAGVCSAQPVPAQPGRCHGSSTLRVL